MGAAKYRTISVNSDSARNMPTHTMEPTNKYKTFQDPFIGNQDDNGADLDSTSGGPFRSIKRNRESASDNKRLLNNNGSVNH